MTHPHNPVSLSCPEVEEWLMLRIYGELPEALRPALEQHLGLCENCRRELASLRALEETLSSQPEVEPSPMLLAETRARLSDALDAEAEKSARRWFPRFLLAPSSILRAAPLAAAMLVAGVCAGGWGGYQVALHRQTPSAKPVVPVALLPQDRSPIASVTSVAPNPDGKGISVSFSRLVPETASGSVDDPMIRRILAAGVQSPTDPAVQDDSVRLLADACSQGSQCDDGNVRAALMTAALYDGDPVLRSKALAGLQPYIAQDTHVRDAVLESLMRDTSSQVRTQAIRMLSPVEADTSVREVLHNVSTRDDDPQIRSLSREALDVGMQIQ